MPVFVKETLCSIFFLFVAVVLIFYYKKLIQLIAPTLKFCDFFRIYLVVFMGSSLKFIKILYISCCVFVLDLKVLKTSSFETVYSL